MNVIPQVDVRLSTRLPFAAHGTVDLPDICVESYSLILREKGRFVGDNVNKSAFLDRLDEHRRELTSKDKDPFGKTPTNELSKSYLADVLAGDNGLARDIVRAAVGDFSEALFEVIRKYRSADKGWRKVRGIVVGGGFSEGLIGRTVISRVQRLLDEASIDCRIKPVREDPDIAGILGAAYLAPAWVFAGFDGLLGVDVGGTNIRCGMILTRMSKSNRFSKLMLELAEHWRHADDEQNRKETVAELVDMLQRVIRKARKAGYSPAPFIGVGCPGRIRPDGTIDRGAHNLPGKWEGESFNLPNLLEEQVPVSKDHETVVVMHNDAVVQGLSQIPHMRKFAHWGILTIGTGLGNAQFTAEPPQRPQKKA